MNCDLHCVSLQDFTIVLVRICFVQSIRSLHDQPTAACNRISLEKHIMRQSETVVSLMPLCHPNDLMFKRSTDGKLIILVWPQWRQISPGLEKCPGPLGQTPSCDLRDQRHEGISRTLRLACDNLCSYWMLRVADLEIAWKTDQPRSRTELQDGQLQRSVHQVYGRKVHKIAHHRITGFL